LRKSVGIVASGPRSCRPPRSFGDSGAVVVWLQESAQGLPVVLIAAACKRGEVI